MKIISNKNYCFIYIFLIINFTSIKLIFPQLDTTFGTDGVVTSTGQLSFLTSVTLQSDNKIVVAGAIKINSMNELALARFNTDGSLDTTFGLAGIQITSIGSRSEANSILLQTDGKIVVGGFAYENRTNFALARYNVDGSLDNTFNDSGFITTPIGTGAQINSVALQSNGKIIAAGASVVGQPEFTLARYNTNGTLDITFGTDGSGIVLTQIGLHAVINQICIQPDDKIVAVGYTFSGMNKIIIARYNSDGSLDTTFGSSGIVSTEIGSDVRANSVALQSNGKIIIAGFVIDSDMNKFIVARYNTNGALDPAFNGMGYTITQIQNFDRAYSVGLQADGKIVAAGVSHGSDAIQFALARYTPSGSLDTTFGVNGVELTTINGSGSESGISSIAMESDDKIVAAGFSNGGLCACPIFRIKNFLFTLALICLKITENVEINLKNL